MSSSEEPNWLDDAEMDAWLPLMGLLVMVPASLDAQMQRVADLNQFEYLILARLSESPERTMRISALAAEWFGSLSRLSHLVKRLEQRGWVRREPDPQDGRYTNAVLTDAGWDKVNVTAPMQVEIVRRLVLNHLSRPQLRQIQTIAARIIDANADASESRRDRARAGRGRSLRACLEPADQGADCPEPVGADFPESAAAGCLGPVTSDADCLGTTDADHACEEAVESAFAAADAADRDREPT